MFNQDNAVSKIHLWLKGSIFAEIFKFPILSTLISFCFVDIVIGFLVFFKKYSKLALIVQIIVTLLYLGFLSIAQPNLWIDPFGVLLKTIPLIFLTFIVFLLEDAR